MIHDVGVAGPHRLPARLADFENADAIVVVAGMEGALPSVVGGYVACPVIGGADEHRLRREFRRRLGAALDAQQLCEQRCGREYRRGFQSRFLGRAHRESSE